MAKEPVIKVCRLCLCRTPVYFSLRTVSVEKMLQSLMSFRVAEGDDGPTVTCVKCLLNLKLAYRIQQRMLIANERLKVEPVYEDYIDFVEVDLKESDKEEVTTDKDEDSSDSAEEPKFYSHFFKEASRIDEDFKSESSEEPAKTIPKRDRSEPTKKSGRQRLPIPEKGIYTCDMCNNKEFPSRRRYLKHRNAHQTKACPICGKVMTYSNLSHHIKGIHGGKEEICDLCGKTFKNGNSLRGHKAHTHNAGCYKCEECCKVYTTKAGFRLHNVTSHSGGPDLVCDVCGYKTFTQGQLGKHMRTTHLKSESIACHVCEKVFSNRCSLRTHLRQHTNETPYKCKECGDGFRQNISLKSHLKSKHGIEESREIPCEVCGKAFATKPALNVHVRKLHS